MEYQVNKNSVSNFPDALYPVAMGVHMSDKYVVLCFSRVVVMMIQRRATVRGNPRLQTGVLSAVLRRAGN